MATKKGQDTVVNERFTQPYISGSGGASRRRSFWELDSLLHSILISEKEKQKLVEEEMAEEGQVIGCHTVEAWNEQLQKANESKKLVVVDFTASWCGPCRMIAPVLAELAKKIPNVSFLKVDVDELRSVATEWEVEAMPTFIFLKEGKLVDKVVGAKKEELHQKVALLAAA